MPDLTIYKVSFFPFGEGTDDDPEPEYFLSFADARLRAIAEIAGWTNALIDPANGDAPSDDEDHGGLIDYARNGAMNGAQSILALAEAHEPRGDDWMTADGPGGNDHVEIRKVPTTNSTMLRACLAVMNR